MEKTIHFISGLPRSGSTLITNLLKQNTEIHGEAVSSLSSIFKSINNSWSFIEENAEYDNKHSKKGVLKSTFQGYYSHIGKPIIIDRSLAWTNLISQLENTLDKQVKVIVCVRNPAEILSSFERLRKENPLFITKVDNELRENSNIVSRAYYYAGPEGILGKTHRNIKDAVTMGFNNRMLFVDYNRFCSTPKAQMKRIYDFLELPNFQHNFENIEQTEIYNDVAVGLPNLHKIKPTLDRTTVNCVEYLGLELYEQYNREIFWNAWI